MYFYFINDFVLFFCCRFQFLLLILQQSNLKTIQRTKWGSDYPNDNIVGYTPSTLNSIVNTSETLGDVRTKLKANKPAGVTDAMIDELINFFNTYKPKE